MNLVIYFLVFLFFSQTSLSNQMKNFEYKCQPHGLVLSENKQPMNLDICKNGFGQFFEKSCLDGCGFKDKIAAADIVIKFENNGSPGGRICMKLNLLMTKRKINFLGKDHEVLFCQIPEKLSSLVSMGYLYEIFLKQKGLK